MSERVVRDMALDQIDWMAREIARLEAENAALREREKVWQDAIAQDSAEILKRARVDPLTPEQRYEYVRDARAAALEEAAQCVLRLYSGIGQEDSMMRHCAAAIRALKETPNA